MSASWRVVLLLLMLLGCNRKWVPPVVEPVQPSDRRVCTAQSRCVDLVLVVDTSGSTANVVGDDSMLMGNLLRSMFAMRLATGPETKLWVGLDGIQSALEQLDPTRVGVALTGFAGYIDTDEPGGPGEGWLEVGVTDEYAAVASALERLRTRGSGGASCPQCAIKLVRSSLPPRDQAGRCEALVMVGDVDVTRPYGPERLTLNQRELIRVLMVDEITNFTIVALAHQDAAELTRIRSSLSTAKTGEVVVVEDATGVAAAIVHAVDSCD